MDAIRVRPLPPDADRTAAATGPAGRRPPCRLLAGTGAVRDRRRRRPGPGRSGSVFNSAAAAPVGLREILRAGVRSGWPSSRLSRQGAMSRRRKSTGAPRPLVPSGDAAAKLSRHSGRDRLSGDEYRRAAMAIAAALTAPPEEPPQTAYLVTVCGLASGFTIRSFKGNIYLFDLITTACKSSGEERDADQGRGSSRRCPSLPSTKTLRFFYQFKL